MKKTLLVVALTIMLCGCSSHYFEYEEPIDTGHLHDANSTAVVTIDASASAIAIETSVPDSVTDAEEAILLFFEGYTEKNLKKMQDVLIESRRDVMFELDDVSSVFLIDCTDVSTNPNEYISLTDYDHPDAYDRAVVKVIFTIEYLSEYNPSGTFTWWYKLVKETEDAKWLIFDWGV